jgi:hypothetical protein
MNISDKNSQKDSSAENTADTNKPSNVGAGPVKSVDDGGKEGEAKQPKERTGKSTNMGGATGGTSGLADASEGNDNTSSE